ncbi:MmcQ/YjbR family DNA-binding protein, partial [Sinorhizobium medicae]
GARGWTSLYFVGADNELVRQSMETAWRNVAPRRLAIKSGDH